MRTQVASGSPTWDLSTQGAYTCGMLEKEGKLEKFDAETIEGLPACRRTCRSEYWIAQIVYSIAIGWRTRPSAASSRQAGQRSGIPRTSPVSAPCGSHPIYNLETALIADGVPMDKLYPSMSTAPSRSSRS